ncbi:MFS transporter [Dictyobacter arantiisoli]|uniref:MFS transporter n=1 Tax=Dictyobacter arantiisoli TaxID=2014874 RepID=A0A5A5TIX4_9CHLR|nr:MFS transporter [Dictyobacter arantiisoli]GCF11292.1 MFS transporter [Dictyobacter arantiisoli]
MSHEVQNSASPGTAGRIDPRIVLLALGMFALGTDAFVVAGVLPTIAREMQVSEGLAGQLVTVFSLTYGLGAPVLAALTGRWPRNRVLLVSLGAFCLVNVGSAISPTFALLLLTRLLAGCCAATFAPLAYTVGTALAPAEKRGQALALVVLGLTVATVFGSPLGTWVGTHLGWRFSFGMVAALAGVAFLALLVCGLPKPTAGSPVLSLKARLAPVAEPRLLLALTPALLWNLGIYTIYTYLAPLLRANLALTDVSGMLLCFGLGVVAGNWSGGMLADRFGAIRPLVSGLVVLVAVYVSLSLTFASMGGAVIALLIWGVAGSIIFIPQQHRLLSIAPEHANVVLALNNSTMYLGIAGGAALGGVIIQCAPINALGWLGAGCVILALLTLLLSNLMGSASGQRTVSAPKESEPEQTELAR